MGGFKDFQDPDSLTCCVGTGMENHSKYGRNIFYHNNNELFVFQFISSELNWREKGIILTQKTSFPEEQGTNLEFKCEKPVPLILRVRYPSWAKNGIEIHINGRPVPVKNRPGSFVPIERTWNTGDNVEIKIPFSLRLESMPDDSNRVAVMYGPLVMAGYLGPVADTAIKDTTYVPIMMIQKRDPSKWIKQVPGKPNTFMTMHTGNPRDVELRPFYSIYNRRYSVYWDLVPSDAKATY
jgi:DUF1680 family protein